MKFVHLHVHTHYSLLDGLTKLDALIEAAKKDNAPAISITDHGVMYGVVEFYQKCKKAGIKPIIGVEAYLAPKSRFDKITVEDQKKNFHLLLLAKNNTGYKNLIKLTSIAHLEGFYYKPRIDWEVLSRYHDGLIACTACLGGEIPTLIRVGKLDKAKQRILDYNQLFGQGNFYLEIMHHPNLEGQAKVNEQLIKFSRELNIPLVATNDVHYLEKDDAKAQDILLCLQNKKKISDENRMNMTGSDYSFRPGKEMIAAFQNTPEAIENTLKIAEKCNVEIELGKIQLPFFEVPKGFTRSSYLRRLCEQGLIKRYQKNYAEIGEQIKERMDYELAVIEKMGWPSYFLIVADFVSWAKENKVIVGPGRGSAAGSLVCYLTGITNLDPLEYDLLFERFLNPDRVSMPDIDLDFSDVRREEVIRYVEKKYGQDHVAQIITFGTMAARAAVRDVGRVLGYPYDYCDRLAKMIPMFTTLNKALETVNELKEFYEQEEGAKNIIDNALRLEGVSRHASTHACGVLITKDPLNENVPLQHASSSDLSIVSQYSLHPVEDLGLLKMDFLGLKNLTIIESAIKIIKNTRGVEVKIDKIPLADKKTYRLFQQGETTGVFQFESSGMKRYLRELKPTEFEDIIAMVALYRPGPMEWIPEYIAGKHGRKKPQYLHPKLEPILRKTYGVAIYQEQVMQMARSLAGFSMAEADVLRKAVGKKIAKLLAEQKDKFVKGCVKNGISTSLAQKIFSFIEPFAGYGFNRSHAACYALIGYQTAYLKSHWPAEFMAALLTADQQNTDRVALEIEECQRMGIKVMSPDINESFSTFTVVTSGTKQNEPIGSDEKVDTIRFGLKAIKNIGENIADALIEERKNNGAYVDLADLLERITDKDLNKKSLESLIKSGSFDKFGERGQLLGNMDNILYFHKEAARSAGNGQASLFADAPNINFSNALKLDHVPEAGQREKLSWEKELLGLYVTEHPYSEFYNQLKDIATPIGQAGNFLFNAQVNLAGIITKIKKIITRSNESMLFVKIEDLSGNLEILVFPKLLKKNAEIWQEGKMVLVQGKLSDKDQELKLLANQSHEISKDSINHIINKFGRKTSQPTVNNQPKTMPAGINAPRPLKILFYENPDNDRLKKLKQIFAKHEGREKVYLKIKQDENYKIIQTAFLVNNDENLRQDLSVLFKDSIKIIDN